MIKTIKKVGVPTNVIRENKKSVGRGQTLCFRVIFKGVEIELKNTKERPFYFGSVDLKGYVNVRYQDTMLVSNENAKSTLWLNNKTLASKIESGKVSSFELEDLIINLDGSCESKYTYEFYSNENDYTLE